MHGLRKIFRDFRSGWGRTVVLIFALALGATALSTTLGAFGTLTREVRRAYVETVPASATLNMTQVSSQLLQEVRRRPEVAAATRRRTLHGRFRAQPNTPWKNALVFVAEDFANMPLAKVFPQRGATEPTHDSVLIERSALSILGGDIGSPITVQLTGLSEHQLTVSGVVHEAALAPAPTHDSLYLYALPSTAEHLGASETFDELRILFSSDTANPSAIERQAQTLAQWITSNDYGQVHEIRVPPPQQHPHQTQMTTVLSLLLAFSVFVLVMSSLVAASLFASILARQLREIGVLKTIGASNAQLARWYGASIFGLSAVALALAWYPATLASDAWATAVADVLNFDLHSHASPVWVLVTQSAVLLVLPTAIALPSILKATQVPVVVALTNFGVSNSEPGSGSSLRSLANALVPRGRVWLAYAVRNAIRQRRKLALSLALLAFSGGVTICAFSVADAWQAWSAQLREEQDYDLEVNLVDSTALELARTQLSRLGQVTAVEAWSSVPTSMVRSGGFPIFRTYPDDAHGAFFLLAAPSNTDMLHVEITDGRWLLPTDDNSVVLNQLVPGQAHIPIGDIIPLSLEGATYDFQVVGKVQQVGVGATAYVNRRALSSRLSPRQLSGRLRLRAESATAQQPALMAVIEQTLRGAGLPVESMVPLGVYQNAMVAHFQVLVGALLALAGLSALVGALGLSSSIAVSLIERTRELGVLRAIGATRSQVRNIVVAEGVIVGSVSLGVALGIGLLLAWLVGMAVGQMSFGLPLPLTPSYTAAAGWALVVLTLSAAASWLPASWATRLTATEAISHV